jgi:hypothetical protein
MWDSVVSAFKDILGLPADVGKGAALFGVAWATVTDYRMWRSIGWLLLGIVVTILGLTIWNRRTIGAAVRAV